MSSGALVVIDGTYGEGAGGIVRTALSMAALTQQGVRIVDIRGNTPYPGVDVEDLLLARTLGNLCKAEMIGLELGSPSLSFLPTKRPSPLKDPICSEQSARQPNALILASTVAPIVCRSGAYSTFTCYGETYSGNSLSFDYFANVAALALKKQGIYCFPELVNASYGREIAGEVRFDVEPGSPGSIQWEQKGRLIGVRAVVTTSNVPESVGQRGEAHLKRLADNSGISMRITRANAPAERSGAFVTCWAEYEGGLGGSTAMGARGLRMEHLAQTAFESLTRWMSSEATADPYLVDQLLLPSIFAESDSIFSTTRLTKRFLSSVWVVKQFLPIHITVKGKEDGPGQITVRR